MFVDKFRKKLGFSFTKTGKLSTISSKKRSCPQKITGYILSTVSNVDKLSTEKWGFLPPKTPQSRENENVNFEK